METRKRPDLIKYLLAAGIVIIAAVAVFFNFPHEVREGGVINWHLVVQPPRQRACTWNDVASIPNDDSLRGGYRGIMEFTSDPR